MTMKSIKRPIRSRLGDLLAFLLVVAVLGLLASGMTYAITRLIHCKDCP